MRLLFIFLVSFILIGCSQKQPDQVVDIQTIVLVPPKSYLSCKDIPDIPEFTLESFDSEIMLYVTELWNSGTDCYDKLEQVNEFIESKSKTESK